MCCFRKAENSSSPIGGGDNKNTKLWDLRGIAMPVMRSGNEREWGLAFVGVKGPANGNDRIQMIADVVEGPLVKVYILFGDYEQGRCDMPLLTLVSSE